MHRFQLRLPDHLHERLIERAVADRRSLNAEILYLLETALTSSEAEPSDREPGHRARRP
jgi:predicted HicB family RNase H-like nuclease